MRISEIFYSIQGEGTNIGTPAIFIRLAGCHLRCVWCDSKFTWDMKSGKEMNTAAIIKVIKKYPCKHLVITGGEPLIQQSGIKELLKKLPEYYVEIETSGTIASLINEFINQYNCSPKLKNSKNRPLTLQKFPEEKTWYKFVIDKKSDLKEIKEMIKKYLLPKDKIILMPQGITREEIAKKSPWVAEICKKENWKFSTRLHIEIWGNKRGV
jgi:organic radical activating enzyme